MNKNILSLVVLALSLAFSFIFISHASAATYYVDAQPGSHCAGGANTSYRVANRDCNGSDGTKSWTTAQGPVSSTAPGDTVYFRAGTYAGSAGAATLSINVSGTSGNPITFARYQSETVNISCATAWNSSWALGGANEDYGPYPENGIMITNAHNYITLDGFTIGGTLGSTAAHNEARCYYGISAIGTGIKILNSEIKYTWGHGISAEGSTNLEVASNRIHDTNQMNFPRGMGCCTAGTTRNTSWGGGTIVSGSGAFVHDNFFYFNHGESLTSSGGTAVFLRNVFSDCWAACTYSDGGSNVTWDSNFIYLTEASKQNSIASSPNDNINNVNVAGISISVEPDAGWAGTPNTNAVTIRNNLTVNTKFLVEGFTGTGYPHNNTWSNFSIVNNTQVGSSVRSAACIQLLNTAPDGGGSITNLIIKNNVCAHLIPGYQMQFGYTSGSGFVVTNNIFDVTTGAACFYSNGNCQTAAQAGYSGSNILTSPGLVNQAYASLPRLWDDVTLGAGTSLGTMTTAQFIATYSAPFIPATGSVAINAGATLGAPYNIDILGVSRPVGSAYDIGAFEYGGSGGTTPPPPPSSCTNLQNSTTVVPTSFGASFNWFTSAKELLMNVICSGSGDLATSATANIGNGSNTQYIYKTGYVWQNSQWTSFNYSGSSMDSGGNWFIGSANHSLGTLDLTQKQSVLSYICDWNGTKWNCGCHDNACSTGYWNLQQFKQ